MTRTQSKGAGMTREELIRMARGAGGSAFSHAVVFSYEDLERFVALVASAEREALICICEKWAKSGGEFSLLDAIRARGQG